MMFHQCSLEVMKTEGRKYIRVDSYLNFSTLIPCQFDEKRNEKSFMLFLCD